jgi:sterol 14alpha-demethylase
LYQEQVKHFGRPDGTFRPTTYEELRELPVLDSVIRETLRVHPPIHSIMRYVRDDVAVPPTLSAPSEDRTYVVPKGHYVLASPAVSQMDPLVWRDADKWDPSRWSDPEGVAAQALKTYVDEKGEKIDYGFGAVSKGTESPYQPFGAGRHRCIGEQVSRHAFMNLTCAHAFTRSLRTCSWELFSRRLSGRWSCVFHPVCLRTTTT